MQKVAAYILDRRDGMSERGARAAEATRLKSLVGEWLKSKGGSPSDMTGTYRPEDNSQGTYRIEHRADQSRDCWLLELDEVTSNGRRFTTTVAITAGAPAVSVYVSLEVGWTTSRIMPVSADPRCPRVVRSLIQASGHWYHGESRLHPCRIAAGFEDGESVVAEILDPSRAVPLVLVSEDGNGNLSLPELDSKLEYDLVGLANVVRLKEAATWALTDSLGPEWCCFGGSVRLFWPHYSRTDSRYRHPLWTAARLRSNVEAEMEIRERFRHQLRSILFRAASLSVIRPASIADIADAASRQAVEDLRQRATSLAEYKELADSYAADNDKLRAERTALSAQVEQLRGQVAKLDQDCEALQAHLRAAKASTLDAEDLSPSEAVTEADPGPNTGDVRFYKKVHSKPAYDVMVRTTDCGCNRWQTSHGADKARKGVAKLENGRSDWKNMQHCGACTGGGMWRVRW